MLDDAGSVRNGHQTLAYYCDIEGRVTKKVQQNSQKGYDITTATYIRPVESLRERKS